jgi:ribosomal protein S18 acetylase RimI-like enzyme
MSHEIEIRHAGPDDFAVVRALLREQFAEHAIEVADDALDAALRAVLADRAAPDCAAPDRAAPDRARGFFLLAQVEQRLAGVAYVALTWTLEHGGRTAWLEELYVPPELRNRGIGRALLRAALGTARERGCAAVDLEVERDHARAENLYRREGFAPLARSRWVRRLAPVVPTPGETDA